MPTNKATDPKRDVDPAGLSAAAFDLDHFTPASYDEVMAFRHRFGLMQPYFLLSGNSLNDDSGVVFFKAFEKLGDARASFMIVCAGNGTLAPEMVACVGPAQVRIGALNDEDMRLAYSGAVAAACLSVDEDSGRSVLGAMACGCPVATCHVPSLRQLGGDAPLYLDVQGQTIEQQAGQLASHLRAVMDPVARAPMIERGLAQADKARRADTAHAAPDAMPTQPTVRVIIPTYNDAATLERAIGSALNQSYPNVSVLVIDDAGPAHAKAWIDVHYKDDARVQCLRHPQNKMLGAARNTGVDNMGEVDYVYFLDADDVLYPRAIESLISVATRTGADVVQGATVKVIAGRVEPLHAAAFDMQGGLAAVESFAGHGYASVAWNKLYRGAFLRGNPELRFIEAYMHEDVSFALRTAYHAKRIVSIAEPVLQYHTNEQSLTQRKPGRINIESYLAVYLDLAKVLEGFTYADEAERRRITDLVLREHVGMDFVPKLLTSCVTIGMPQFRTLLHDVAWDRLGTQGAGLACLIESLLAHVLAAYSEMKAQRKAA